MRPLAALCALALGAGAAHPQESAGAIAGTVRLTGAAPKAAPLDMAADPRCIQTKTARKAREQDVLVGRDGGLANVFVRLEGGAPAAAGPVPPEPVVIEQRGCIYYPRMTGARVGQTLRVVNLDDTVHNVRSLSEAGSDFNVGQPFAGMEFDFELAQPEEMLELRCDVHPWMRAYVGVTEHPWFAVTDDDGRFELEGVPAGARELVFWHERYGTLRRSVAVETDGVATVEADYPADSASR